VDAYLEYPYIISALAKDEMTDKASKRERLIPPHFEDVYLPQILQLNRIG